MKILGWSNEAGGVHHYRIREPLRGLKRLGHETHVSRAVLGGDVLSYDVLLVRGLHNARNSVLWRSIAAMGERKTRLVFDMDDDAWAWAPGSKEDEYWTDERRYNLELNIQCADLVTTPSPRLAAVLENLNPNVAVLPNCVPEMLLRLTPDKRDKFIVGWQGASQHVRDLQLIYNPVFRFMLRHPSDVELHLWGPGAFADLPRGIADRVVTHRWIDSTWQHYYRLNMDVGLAPLDPSDPFNDTKSDIRLREYAALGIPAIASDVPAYVYTATASRAFLVTEEYQWENCLEMLYMDRQERANRAKDARIVARDWTTESNARKWEASYVYLAGQPPGSRSPGPYSSVAYSPASSSRVSTSR